MNDTQWQCPKCGRISTQPTGKHTQVWCDNKVAHRRRRFIKMRIVNAQPLPL